jgi:hypothetical protein
MSNFYNNPKNKKKTLQDIREDLKKEYDFDSSNVVAAITNHETCPLFVPEMAVKRDKAYEYIQTLSKRSQKRLYCKINSILNEYYRCDENGVSCYSMDQMFL